MLTGIDTAEVKPNAKVVATPTSADRDCLTRAMYFEANRSSDEGLLAVGTVVMNRLDNASYPASVCGVVGQPKQFAQGVLTKPMRASDQERIERVADALLAGKRHKGIGGALHFHIAGRTYRYPNMHYVAATGGNRFYVKKTRDGDMPERAPDAVVKTASGLVPIKVAFAEATP
nr:cell wall hydrolase [Enterovirga rhinocerotis]